MIWSSDVTAAAAAAAFARFFLRLGCATGSGGERIASTALYKQTQNLCYMYIRGIAFRKNNYYYKLIDETMDCAVKYL